MSGRRADEETACCADPVIWVAAVVSSGRCHARLERCATCEDHRAVSWWEPETRGWASGMGHHAARLRAQVVEQAYTMAQEDADADRA